MKYLILVFFLFNSKFIYAEKEKVTFSFYNDSAPWQTILSQKKGITFDFVNWLNEDENSPYIFSPEYIPRKRLDRIIVEEKEPIIIAWVNPKFFADLEKKKFLWSYPLLTDSQYILSSKKHPLEFNGIESLYHLNFSAVLGSNYLSLQKSIDENLIKRVDTGRFEQAIQKVIIGNRDVDFCLIEKSAYLYYKYIDPMQLQMENAYISKNPITPEYERSLMVPLRYPKLFKYINSRIKNINTNKWWNEILIKYALDKKI